MNPVILRNFVFPAYHRMKKTGLLEIMDTMENNQWLKNEELRNLQKMKLRNLLQFAGETVPYYRDKFKDADFDANSNDWFESFTGIPLLTKGIINTNRDKLVASSISRSTLVQDNTSGSTGEALYFYTDLKSRFFRQAAVLRNYKWLNIQYGDKTASLWGAAIDIKKAKAFRSRMHDWVVNSILLSSYDLSDATMNAYEKNLNSFQPALLTSYPGPLTVFSEYLLANNRKVPSIRAIISSAETLYPWQKEIIEKAFSTQVYNRYGCREFGAIAQECPKREGLHINTDRLFVEILDANGKQVAEGETGEIVITDLDNYGMPMIRYRIGDMGSFHNSVCSCGRGLPLFKNIEGRTLDVVRASNGNRIGGTFWTLLFRSKPGIKAFQVVQETPDKIKVKYVRDMGFDRIPHEYFIGHIKEKCGLSMMVIFEEVPAIPKTASGKTRMIISEIKD